MYRITSSYCWYSDWINKNRQLVKMYFINGIPFTWDDLEDIGVSKQDIPKLKIIADNQRGYNIEDLYNYYSYLIEEQCNPLLFDMELENPEDLPDMAECEEDLPN